MSYNFVYFQEWGCMDPDTSHPKLRELLTLCEAWRVYTPWLIFF